MNHDLKRCSRGNKCLHPDKVEDGWLPRTEFHKNRTRPDGLQIYCRTCNSRRLGHRSPESEHRNRVLQTARNANNTAKRRGAPGILTTEQLERLYSHQEGRCFYCQSDLELDHIDSHLDHLVPFAKGGTNYLENVVWACGFCNRAKNDHSETEYLDWLVSVIERWPELRERLERRDHNAGGDLPSGGRVTRRFRVYFG